MSIMTITVQRSGGTLRIRAGVWRNGAYDGLRGTTTVEAECDAPEVGTRATESLRAALIALLAEL